MGEVERRRAREKALSLFKTGIIGSILVKERGSVGAPIPVRHPEGGFASWFVPVTVGDRIAGFFQFGTHLKLLRYASFMRDPERVDSCPTAASWIDPATVKKRAASLAGEGEELQPPYLTYDANVSRLVWAVKASGRGGASRVIYVAGDYAYLKPDRGGEPVTGSPD